jgi:hypothetical protein
VAPVVDPERDNSTIHSAFDLAWVLGIVLLGMGSIGHGNARELSAHPLKPWPVSLHDPHLSAYLPSSSLESVTESRSIVGICYIFNKKVLLRFRTVSYDY